MRVQQLLVEGRRGHVRRLPGGEHGQGALDQPLIVRGRESGAARAMITLMEVSARKAGLEPLRQPHGESAPVASSGMLLQTSQEGEPIRSIQCHGQRDRQVEMEEVRQLIHLLQDVVGKHGNISRNSG
jgi:hypothetical protein